jgi:RNA polymerase sigma-70 factor (ECF subfamily)
LIDIDLLYRAESGRVLATLIRLLGDFDLAEDALQDAFVAAAAQWPETGVPRAPRSWLVSAGRFSALRRLRWRARFDRLSGELVLRLEGAAERDLQPEALAQDQLRLLFTCCHPALGLDAQLALTLREVCGLRTEQIAAAFRVKPADIAQRMVRTKRKIRDEQLPYEVPAPNELSERLERVLHVVYLVFNEGYSASLSAAVTRLDLCAEAIRLARELGALLLAPDVSGLLALMLLVDARRAARVSASGDLVLLADQDRSLWDRARIAEGLELLEQALQRPPVGVYTIQAAIAAVHARAPTRHATDWGDIVRLYDLLRSADPTPVVELNRAVAVAEHVGPAAGLALIDAILARGELGEYRFAHAACADLLRCLGRRSDAVRAYRRALELSQQEPERRFLERRLPELGAKIIRRVNEPPVWPGSCAAQQAAGRARRVWFRS